MLARVLVLAIGLICGLAAGAIGIKWMIGASSHAAAVDAKRNSTDEKVKGMVERYDNLKTASYLMLASMPLAILGGILGGMGRGKLAAIPLLLALILPLIGSGWSLFVTFALLFAVFLGFIIRRPQNQSELGIAGCFNALKGWFNIGGVKVKFKDLDTNVSMANNSLACTVELTAKGGRHVNAVYVKFIRQETKSKKDDEGKSKSETKEKVLGEATQALDIDLEAGENRVLEFQLDYEYEKGLKDVAVGLAGGGITGSLIGFAADFASGTKQEFYLVAEADVDGALFEPYDKKKMAMVE
jgi:hypothetical protein